MHSHIGQGGRGLAARDNRKYVIVTISGPGLGGGVREPETNPKQPVFDEEPATSRADPENQFSAGLHGDTRQFHGSAILTAQNTILVHSISAVPEHHSQTVFRVRFATIP